MAATKAPTPSAAATPSASPGPASSAGAAASAPKPMIPASHQPTPAQQNPQVRRPLAPTLPPPDPNAPPDPVTALNQRQKAAIESRMAGGDSAQVRAAGVDGAAPRPKPASPASSQTRGAAAPAASDSAPTRTQTPDSAAPASTSAPKGKPEPAKDSAATSEPSATPSAADPQKNAGADTSSAPAPLSFTPKAFKKWAEENPEAALQFRQEIDRDTFRMEEDPKNEWIRQTNRSRKIKDEIRAQRAEIERIGTEKEAAAKAHLEAAEKTAGQLRYLTEMWGAFQGKGPNGERVIDFDAADEAFRQNSGGLSVDEYVRARARRGLSNPEAAKERAERRRLELEVQRLNGATKALPEGAAASAQGAAQGAPEAVKPAAAPAAPAETGRHADPETYWGDEVPKNHPIRKLAGWGKLVDTAMAQFHDDVLDEYSRDAEDVANEVFKRQLAALGGGEEDDAEKVVVKPHARAKPKTPKNRGQRMVEPDAPPANVPGIGYRARDLVPRGKVNTDRSHREARPEDLMGDGGMAARQRWAIERAQMRLQGIDPDTGEPLGG